MRVAFREARRADVAAVVDLLMDDFLGSGREGEDPEAYLAAFDTMEAEGNNHLIVGEAEGQIVATYQITFISGLSLRASRRANIESVRVSSRKRRHGIGAAMIADAEARAHAANCSLIQLTMNAARTGSRAFYESLGFSASHHGFKKPLRSERARGG